MFNIFKKKKKPQHFCKNPGHNKSTEFSCAKYITNDIDLTPKKPPENKVRKIQVQPTEYDPTEGDSTGSNADSEHSPSDDLQFDFSYFEGWDYETPDEGNDPQFQEEQDEKQSGKQKSKKCCCM